MTILVWENIKDAQETMRVKAPEKIETARLLLHHPTANDIQAVFVRYAGDPEVTRFVAWRRHTSIADTQSFFEFSEAEWDRWPAGPYLVRSRADGELLGSAGLAFDSQSQASTGYVLAREAWGPRIRLRDTPSDG